ncbi:hypothetical protein [Methylocaldum sp.]|uniref:hypothetical protein n=1 Tax=Methylocaldum sp. TaxID=1969727 RepID=UPI002D55EE1E|nr:hypothetical protein [Methylocaldum sp.]HYE37016.1 hypothetical protein [Methylocaldum sp.]
MAQDDSTESDRVAFPAEGTAQRQTSLPFKYWLDIASAILLSVAALASSWAGYQSKRWSGVQSANYNTSSTLWVQSSRVATFAYLYRSIDLELFIEWLNAYKDGDAERARFFEQRFRPEFRPAFEAWVASQPLENAAAPSSPFVLPEYRLELSDRAAQLEQEAGTASDHAQAANQQGDDYVLSTVIFSATLFFTGIAAHFSKFRVRVALLIIAGVMALVGVAQLATYPVR